MSVVSCGRCAQWHVFCLVCFSNGSMWIKYFATLSWFFVFVSVRTRARGIVSHVVVRSDPYQRGNIESYNIFANVAQVSMPYMESASGVLIDEWFYLISHLPHQKVLASCVFGSLYFPGYSLHVSFSLALIAQVFASATNFYGPDDCILGVQED